MKILCVADHLDPLVYSPAVKERYRGVELVIGAGDLPMSYLGFIASSLNKPVLFVFGNHNLDQYELFNHRAPLMPAADTFRMNHQHHYGSTYIDRRVILKKGVLFAGLGGSVRYNNGQNQYTEFQMTLRILSLVPKMLWHRLVRGRFLDVLVTHAPPRGIHDKEDNAHRGFSCFLWFMRAFRPRYLLHGHIHLYDLNERRVSFYRDTEVINVYDHYILELDADG
ncbi:MAG: metallophosphoesterase family protein [Spirochaetota bacterium]